MSLLSLASGLFAPLAHAAGNVTGVIDSVGQNLPDSGAFSGNEVGGISAYTNILVTVAERLRPILAVAGVLMICFVGYRMIVAQDDSAVEKGKNSITLICVGLVLAYMIVPFMNAFYGIEGQAILSASGATVLEGWVYMIVSWAMGIMAALAMFSIVITGLEAILAPWNEEGVTRMRRAIFAVAAGIILLLIRFTLVATFIGQTPYPIIQGFVGIVTYFLAFAALAAVAVIIYAGIQLIVNLADAERAQKAKQLLLRALGGLAIIIVSYALVRFIIGFAF